MIIEDENDWYLVCAFPLKPHTSPKPQQNTRQTSRVWAYALIVSASPYHSCNPPLPKHLVESRTGNVE